MIIIDGCIGCGQCAEKCGNIVFEGYSALIDYSKCKQCGKCLKFDCPGEAFKEVDDVNS